MIQAQECEWIESEDEEEGKNPKLRKRETQKCVKLLEVSFSREVKIHKAKVVSVFNSEGPPVPIPNTEVKLVCADNTRLEATREDRSMLTPREVFFRLPLD